MFSAACRPSWIAGWASWPTGFPSISAMSPAAKIRSWPCTRRSGPVASRPCRPCSRPRSLTRSGAATPAAHTVMSLASSVPSASVTLPCDTALMLVPVRTSTPRCCSCRQAYRAQRPVERGDQRVGLLDQPDVQAGRVDVRVGRGQGDVAQLGQGAGQLHAGRAAAHDGDRQAGPGPAPDSRSRPLVQPVAQRDRVPPGVQAPAVLGRAGDAEERRGHADGQDQVVVVQRAAVGQHDPPGRGVEPGQVAAAEPGPVTSSRRRAAGRPRPRGSARRWPPGRAAAGRCCTGCGPPA